MIRPPRLREGACVALVAPAGPVTEERISSAFQRCRQFGLEPVLGANVRLNFAGYLAGSDAARLEDLQAALADPDIDAIWALRGGYGTMRLLPGLDLTPLVERPRAYIGFSDNTAVHLALHARGVVSFHGPHAGGNETALAERCLRRVIWSAEPAGILDLPDAAATTTLHGGVAEGPLVGGNLALLSAMCGTPAPPRAAGAILFAEDIGEEPYRLDRMWTQLWLSGALDGVAGVMFGQFTGCGEPDAVLELLHRFVEPLGVPAAAGFPIGHHDDNWTLPLGVGARLDATNGTLELTEAAVT